MKTVNINNLNNILNQIWGQLLPHNQSRNVYSTRANPEKRRNLCSWDYFLRHREDSELCYEDSMEYNNLTKTEAYMLFSPFATKNFHKSVLNSLKTGRRCELDTLKITPESGDNIINYRKKYNRLIYRDGETIINIHPDEVQKVEQFFDRNLFRINTY